uniref:DNA-directed DNA polymerase family A palm domain-containing protein n=1 Tax=Knipowitschia caucasica TaxID=637954 RepID=A0AAV2KRV4_KNICA
MLNGGQFVEAVGRLGYPDASSLKASEFDWLFDCAPENLHFLRFVCRTLNSSNILTLEEASAFQELQKSGKPILDEAALEEVLKTIGLSDGSTMNSTSCSVFATDGEITSEALEAELKALQKEKDLKQKRYNKLQLTATSRADVDLRLTAEMEKTANALKETNALIGAENALTNTVLQNLTDEMKRLSSLVVDAHDKNGRSEPFASSVSLRPSVLLSLLSLDPYLQQEELNTKTLAAFTQKHFFKGISDIVESSYSGRLQLLDLSSCEDEETSVYSLVKDSEGQEVERRRTEMARLQWAHIVAHYQLIQALAEEKSLTAALDWVSEKSSHVKRISLSSSLHMREVVLKKELQAVETELEALLQGPVPAALRESARQVNVPIVRGDLALQLARQDYYTQRQNQVRDYLLRQKASFDLLHLAQEMELRRWTTCFKELEEVCVKLTKHSEAVSHRIDALAHPDLIINPRPNPIINSKDVAFSRLLEILNCGSKCSPSEPFQTYEALNQAARDLSADLQTAGEAMAGAAREQKYTGACLHGHCEALHRAMYTELQQVVLRPQVPPLASEQPQLCPNAQELSMKLMDAESQLQRLQQVMQEIMTQKILTALRAQRKHVSRVNTRHYQHDRLLGNGQYEGQWEPFCQSTPSQQEGNSQPSVTPPYTQSSQAQHWNLSSQLETDKSFPQTDPYTRPLKSSQSISGKVVAWKSAEEIPKSLPEGPNEMPFLKETKNWPDDPWETSNSAAPVNSPGCKGTLPTFIKESAPEGNLFNLEVSCEVHSDAIPCSSFTAQKKRTDEIKHGSISVDGPNHREVGKCMRSKPGNFTSSLTSDPRVTDASKLSQGDMDSIVKKAQQSVALVLTMVFRDGTTHLDPEQKRSPPACGLLLLIKTTKDTALETLGPKDILLYLKLECAPAWAQHPTPHIHEMFTRDLLLQVFSSSALVVCYKAKDVLRVLRQLYKREFTWKQVQGCQIHDPQLSGWLLDPTDPATCFQDLLYKHCRNPCTTPALGTKKVTQIITGLCSLYRLNIKLCEKLKNQGLWQLYSDMELKMLPVLAAMEVCQIHVDKEALKRTSDLLGTKMKQLEQEAHKAAGQMFLLTSSTQLRTVLFERLCLHEHCENKKLPKTINKQQSTSEAALLQLQDLHPLPKIILEYRQNYISSTWHQTSVVTGRVSATHPNFQALPRQPLQVTRKQFIAEKEDEVVTVHPRAMFVPKEGWTFLSADFCQVELRLLAHLSSDPELLRVFTSPEADVFNMLASQWKGVSVKEVSSEDREHAKRIVYSVVYGAGLERLSGILGVSTEQARRFQDSFLQTYMEVQKFIQKTVAECQQKGYVLSIMGRRRTLHNINSPDWSVRMQAERQAVNFVVQGSAADLCKMAMIRIFNLLSTSSSVSARLVAQLHDELLYEVEDSQIQQFAAVVKSTMESLEHIDQQNIHLKVPLKVAVSSGKSWGSMSELNV